MAVFQEMLAWTGQAMPLGLIPSIAKFRVADIIGDGEMSISDIAAATGTNAASLRRVMRILVAYGVFARRPDAPDGQARFANNARSHVLRSDVVPSLWGWGRFWLDVLPVWSKVPEFLQLQDGAAEEAAPWDLYHGQVCARSMSPV